jgi:hypothetical protein
LVLSALFACGEGPAGTDNEEPEITDTVSTQLAVDAGQVGVLVDVREIARKGYIPATVAIGFPAYPAFDATLDVDAVTGLAILRIQNDALTQSEQDAFAGGVAANLVVRDAAGTELASRAEASLVLDDSGIPLSVETSLPRAQLPLAVKDGVPYLLQPETGDGVLARRFAGLGAETETAPAGGTPQVGSITVPGRCPDGAVAIGLSGEAGSGVSSIALTCAVLESDGTLGQESETLSIGNGPSTGPVARECPLDGLAPMLLVRDAGQVTPGAFDRIRSVRGLCLRFEDVAAAAASGSATATTGALGGAPTTGDQPYDLSCPDGAVVTGIRGAMLSATGEVIRVSYFCRALTADWGVQPYVPQASGQPFSFTAVAGAPDDNTYVVRQASRFWVALGGEIALSSQEPDADAFVLEQDDDGWVRIRLQGTSEYLVLEQDGRISLSTTAADRFRLITDDIAWTVTDRGTTYHQPIKPPAQLDFAYAATIKNCSPAGLTETIGRTESRTQTTSFSTEESLQLFAGYELTVGATIGFEVGLSVAAKATAEISVQHQLTVSATQTSSNTLSEESSKTTEVSRTRALDVPAFTAVEAYDAIRTIKNFRVPFTQVYRFSGTYQDGSPLSGEEILSQMHFNLVEGVPVAVGAQYVDIGIRGRALVDQMFEAESQVRELPGGCN